MISVPKSYETHLGLKIDHIQGSTNLLKEIVKNIT